MELTVPLISLPAIIALILKGGVYVYVRIFSVTRNLQSRLFLLFLLALAIQNVAEISIFYDVNVKHSIPNAQAVLFYCAITFAVALLFHLSVSLALDVHRPLQRILPTVVYAIASVIVVLLVFSDLLVKDFEILSYPIGNSVTRVRGPFYFLIELVASVVLTSALALSVFGAIRQQEPRKRVSNRIFLIAIAPMAILIPVVLGLLHLGIKWINATVTMPFFTTYFLAVASYAIHHRRFLDSDSEFSLRARQQLAEIQRGFGSADSRADEISTRSFDEQISELEVRLIKEALQRSNGNQANAARMLGLRPNTFHYKMKRYGIS